MTLTIDQFLAVDIRVGTVVEAEPFPEARKPAYRLRVDFGPELGIRRTSAQITHLYQPAELIGRQVCGAVNLPPRQIGPVLSEFLLLGFADAEGRIVLIEPERPVPNGARLH